MPNLSLVSFPIRELGWLVNQRNPSGYWQVKGGGLGQIILFLFRVFSLSLLFRSTILDKTVEKIAYLRGIFSKLRSRPILPFPPPPGSSVVGSSKESRIPKHL